MPINGRLALLLTCQFLIGTPVAASPEKAPALEYQVKAAYIYNFTRFVTWPSNGADPASAPIRVCTFGEDPFGDALDRIGAKPAKGRLLEVSRLVTPDEIESCQVLFVGDQRDLTEILTRTERSNVLTVGEGKEFTELGGIIRFKIDEERRRFQERASVSFEINTDAAARSGLQMSSRLLNLATLVGDSR